MEQEPTEVRLADFRNKIKMLKLSHVNDATLQSVGEIEKLGQTEARLWDKYVMLLRSVEGLSSEAVTDAKVQVSILVADLKQEESCVTDEDTRNFYAWMRNRLMILSGFVNYLDDPESRKEILDELVMERKKLEV